MPTAAVAKEAKIVEVTPRALKELKKQVASDMGSETVIRIVKTGFG
jgi:hypothetical protein